MKPVSALFVTRSIEWGGTEQHLLSFIGKADRALLQPAILTFGRDKYASGLEQAGLRDVPVRREAQLRPGSLRESFADLRPQVIVFVNGKLGLFPWWAYLLARLSGARKVVGLEHSVADVLPRRGTTRRARARDAIGWRGRYLLRASLTGYLAHETVCVSHAVRARLLREYRFPDSRTITVQNGIDLRYYRRSGRTVAEARAGIGLDPNVAVVVYIARLVPEKRVDVLLRAVSLLRARQVPLQCVILGTGSQEAELKALQQQLGLAEAVAFTDHQEDVRPYLEAATVYATSSDREGLPLSLAEAMAYALPCVATDIGGHDELLATPGSGMLVPPGNPEEMARAIAHLLSHPAEARAMGAIARRTVEERFSLDRMVNQLMSVLLGPPRPRR